MESALSHPDAPDGSHGMVRAWNSGDGSLATVPQSSGGGAGR